MRQSYTETETVAELLPHELVTVYVTIADPRDKPETTPVDELTVAIVGVPLLHTPPVTLSVKCDVESTQIESEPDMITDGGTVFTVIGVVTVDEPQVFVTVYDITVAPTVLPETTPELDPTVAIEELPLVHIPPATLDERVITDPAQTVVPPEMVPADGRVITVIDLPAAADPQAFVTEYEIIADPTLAPVTTPDDTVAIDVLELLHTPPDVPSDRVQIAPTQTADGPVIAGTVGGAVTDMA